MNLYKELIQSKKTLTDVLLDEITDYDIYCELSGEDIEIGRAFRSPVREDDTRASFSIFIPDTVSDVREDEIWWRDFSTKEFGNVFSFVQKYAQFHYEYELTTRKEIIAFLDQELELGIFEGEKVVREKRIIDWEEARKKRDIIFQSREFTRRDIFWWAMYAIDVPLLQGHNVRSIKHFLNEDHTIRSSVRQMELAFAYMVFDKVKVYRPEAGEFKWRNTCPSHYIQGIQQCTGQDTLIITKSMKDLLCFKSLMHVDAIALQGEGMRIPQNILDQIKKLYKNVYVVMDYDPTGIEAAEDLEKEGFIIKWVSQDQTLIDGKLKVLDKDLSDHIYNNGVRKSMERLQEMFPTLPSGTFRHDRVDYFEDLKRQLMAA